jgi:glycosyltransferase involved in cell wall biosynthesis
MSQLPLLSVITVVYNASATIEKTINSVVNQDYYNLEFIVIDGGSTDGTVDIIKRFEGTVACWISEPDQGIYYAMNKGLQLAKGEYVTFLNSGDYYCNESVLSNLFSDVNDEDVVYGDMYVVEDQKKQPRYQKALRFSKEILLKRGTAVVCHQAFFVKRIIAPRYNVFYRYKAELNWYFDIIELNKDLTIKYKQMPVVFYPLGGFGFLNYRNNLWEWVVLILSRYGLFVFLRHNLHKTIWNKYKYYSAKLREKDFFL